MKIACLGWGSLVWNAGSLPLLTAWHEDGPLLPIEFARESGGRRVTLVITPGAPKVRVLWALVDAGSSAAARELLRIREGKPVRDQIGVWDARHSNGETALIVRQWAEERRLEAVVWTDLPPRWNGVDGTIPDADQVIDYLRSEGAGSEAEAYVRRAPRQIQTPYRHRIEASLGWTPLP
jgi:hypothetical protein